MAFKEDEFLVKARKFDLQALTAIYDEYNEAIYRYAYRRLGSESLAEECTAETFQRFLDALEKGKGPKNYLRAYLYRIAHNWVTDFYRKPYQEEPELPENLAEKTLTPEEKVITHQQNNHIQKALNQLPASQQHVIYLKFIEEWDNAEIAKSMQKTVGAVKTMQNRALKNLKKYFESVRQ